MGPVSLFLNTWGSLNSLANLLGNCWMGCLYDYCDSIGRAKDGGNLAFCSRETPATRDPLSGLCYSNLLCRRIQLPCLLDGQKQQQTRDILGSICNVSQGKERAIHWHWVLSSGQHGGRELVGPLKLPAFSSKHQSLSSALPAPHLSFLNNQLEKRSRDGEGTAFLWERT